MRATTDRPNPWPLWPLLAALLGAWTLAFALYAHTVGGGAVRDPLQPASTLADPSWLRAAQLVVHGLVGWLLAVALWRRASVSSALLAGALFIAHPLAAEAVARVPFAGAALPGYLAALASAPLLAVLVWRLLPSRWPRLAAASVLLLGAALWTVQRAVPFTSNELYWAQKVVSSPRAARAQAALGTIYARQGRHDDARRLLRRALDLEPGLCGVRAELGQLELDRGKISLGLIELRRALRCAPSVEGHRRLAAATLRFGWAGEAEGHARAGLASRPGDVALRQLLGRAQQAQGKLDAALATYRALLQADARAWRVRIELARVQALRCRLTETAQQVAALRRQRDVPAARLQALERLLVRARRHCRSVRAQVNAQVKQSVRAQVNAQVNQSVRVKVKSSK